MKLKRTLLALFAVVLTFTAIFAITMFNTSAADGDVVTPYGTVPANKISEYTYVALFAQTGVDANGNPTYKFLETGTGDESTKNNVFIEKGVDRARQFLNVNTGTYRADVSYGNVVVYMLKDCLSSRGKGWQSANNIDGKVTIDLGGHTLTATDPRLLGFEALTSTAAGKDVATTIEFKNGTLKTSKPLHEVYGNSGIYEGTKVANVIYDGVTFVPNGTLDSFTMVNVKGGYNTTQKVDFEIEFNNCTFNYDKATKLTIINDTAADGSVTCTAKINRNCTMNMDAMPTVSGTSSEDRFGWGAGEYGTIPFDKLLSDSLFASFAKKPGESKYSFVATYGSFYNGAMNNSKNLLIPSESAFIGSNGTAAILMLADATNSGGTNGTGWNHAAKLDGTLIIDFDNHILDSTAARLLGFLAAPNTFDSTIILKNGTLRTSKIIAEVWTEGAAYTGTKNCNLIFEDLIIIRSGSPSSYTMLATKTNSSAGFNDTMKAKFNVEFNNCTIDYSTASDFKILNDGITIGAVECNVTAKGGNISAKTSLLTSPGFTSNDSFTFIADENGKRTTFVFDYAADCSKTAFMTDNGEMHLASYSVGTRTAYELSNVYIDGYGYLPTSEVNKTFSVFDAERKLHLGSYDSYANGALERVRSLTNSYSGSCNGFYKEGTVSMILHKDYAHNDGWYGNYAHIAGTFIFDLRGHTIVQEENGLFNFIAKKSTFGSNPSVLNTTTTIVKNGTILTRLQPVVKINNNRGTGNFDYEGTKEFNITFDNVTFDKYWDKNDTITTYNSIIYSEINGTLDVDVNATFTNCNFTSCNATMFDASLSNAAKVNVTINGGAINTNDMSTLNILKSSDENDTLTFGKDVEGNYTALTLPASAPAPTAYYNGGALAFVKVENGTETATYRLRDKSTLGITYSPKMSITLDRELYLNVYIPAESLVSFTFEGTAYENLNEAEHLAKTVGGKKYYLISTPLPSSEAARKLSLTVTIENGNDTTTGNFTFSIPKYAKKVLGAGTLVDKQVVRDVLSYIRAAYVYFESDDGEAISTIDTLIGKNYDVTSPVMNEGSATASTNGLVGASLNLTATPGIRFYLANGANASDFTFYLIENGAEVLLAAEEGADDNGRYLEVDVYAYAMCETIYYRTADGASGNYHIASYHAFAKEQNNAALVNLVERLWKYAQSARDYRNAVKVTVNFVDESGNALADSQSVTKAPGKEVSFISPAVSGYYTRDLYVYSSATENEVINVVYKPIPTNVDATVASTLISNITAWGDSITQGSNAGNIAAANDHGIDLVSLGSSATGGNYCIVLRNLIRSKVYSSTVVYNLGVGSETTATIAARANTENYYFYLTESATLTDAPIVIDIQQNKGLNLDGRIGVLRRDDTSGGGISIVYMTGKDESGNEVTVKGTLTCDLTSDAPAGAQKYNCDYQYLQYTFTRTDGKTNKVTFDEDTRVVTSASVTLDGNTCIIFMGENGGYNRDNATIIAQQEEILEACGNPEYFLIISSTSKTTAQRQSLNDALTERWGDNYINMGNVLNSSRASYEFAGYSEEAIVAVLDNIIEGSVTDLLLADGCHPNAVGYTVIANAMFERLYKIGAFDALFDYYDSLNA